MVILFGPNQGFHRIAAKSTAFLEAHRSTAPVEGSQKMQNQPFFIPSMLIGLMSIPLIFGLISKNRFYGFRTLKTMSDDKLWYRANRQAGSLFLFSSAVYLAFAVNYPMTRQTTRKDATPIASLDDYMAPLSFL